MPKIRKTELPRTELLHDFLADSLYALRMMRKSPAFSAAAVLTLALGMGVNAAMFGIVYGLLYRPLPFPNADRIAMVHMHFSPQNNPRGNLSIADFVDWQNGNTAFERVAAYGRTRFVLTGDREAEQVAGAAVTAAFFPILGLKPILGRVFQDGDDSAAAPSLVIISRSLWRRRFGGTPDAIGRVIDVNGSPSTIVGIIEGAYDFPIRDSELWQNLHLKVTRRGPFFYQGIGLLRRGMTLQHAQAEMNVIADDIERANPGVYSRLTMPLESLRNYLVGDLRPVLFMMFAAVIAVLLIAAVNVANLLLARASTRQHEIAVRLSVGAGASRLIRQLLTESIVLSFAGALLGIFFAVAGMRAFRALNPANLPLTYQVQVDWSVLLFTFAIAVSVALLFGTVPAFQIVRGDLQSSLREGQRGGSNAGDNRMRNGLVIAEIALSLVLLVSAGLLLRSYLRLERVDAGFSAPPQNLLTMVVTPKNGHGRSQSASDTALVGYYTRLLEAMNALPGVQSAAISDSVPPDQEGEDDTFNILGRPWSQQAFPSTTIAKISPEYFRLLGVPLKRGRFFSSSDTATSSAVTIISESLARRYFADRDPLGEKIQASAPANGSPFMEIVGVVGDLKYWGLQKDSAPAYYQPYTQNPTRSVFLVLRSAEPAATLAPLVERHIHNLDKDAVVRRVLTMEDLVSANVAAPRFRAWLITLFGTLALLLATLGIYGVIAYSVSQRTREIGTRMALGAQRKDVLKMVLAHGTTLALVGLAIGFAATAVAVRAVAPFLYATQPEDPLTFILGALVLLSVATLATLVPALRAIRVDPLVALRYE